MLLGCKGEFEIVLESNSSVDIEYKLRIKKEEKTPSNIIFKIDNNSKKGYHTLKELFEKENLTGVIKANSSSRIVYKLYWEWPFETLLENGSIDEEKDKADWLDGISASNYVFYISVEAMQLNEK